MIAAVGTAAVGVAVCLVPNWVVPVLAPPANPDYGLIEIAQVLVLVAVLRLSWRATKAASDHSAATRWFWCGVVAVTFVVTLEEFDYGLALFEATRGDPAFSTNFGGGWRNLHNRNAALQVAFKGGSGVAQVVLFGIVAMVDRPIGPMHLRRRHGIYFWGVNVALLLLYLILRSGWTSIDQSELQRSQIVVETRELAMYVLLWVALREHAPRALR